LIVVRAIQATSIEINEHKYKEKGDVSELQNSEKSTGVAIESKNDYEYLLFQDLKPAGFEATEVRGGYIYEGLPAYREFHDERVDFFLMCYALTGWKLEAYWWHECDSGYSRGCDGCPAGRGC
jgi:hypothetical protein